MIPTYMTVNIYTDTTTTTIEVFHINETTYESVVSVNGFVDYSTEIHNHVGTDLELLEKILNGRNMS